MKEEENKQNPFIYSFLAIYWNLSDDLRKNILQNLANLVHLKNKIKPFVQVEIIYLSPCVHMKKLNCEFIFG